MSRNSLTRRSFVGAAAATAFAPYVGRANAAGPIRVISHRQPALEYYTDQMKKALPEGQVSVDRGVTIGYFSQDVGEKSGRSVVAETMDGAGPVSEVAAELKELEHALADPARAD